MYVLPKTANDFALYHLTKAEAHPGTYLVRKDESKKYQLAIGGDPLSLYSE